MKLKNKYSSFLLDCRRLVKRHEEGATVKTFFKPRPNGGDFANEVTRAEVMFAYLSSVNVG